MTAIRNSAVAFSRSTAAGTRIIYTVPAGFVLLLKSVEWMHWGSTAGAALIRILTTGAPAFQQAEVASLAPSTAAHFSIWVPCNEGFQIQVQAPDTDVDTMIGGALLPFAPGL